MHVKTKDKFLLYLISLVALAGVIGSLLWDSVAGVIAILVIGWFVATLLILQRAQVAKLQERALMVLRQGKLKADPAPANSTSKTGAENALKTRKILDILQAQQISMEILAARMDENTDRSTD